MKHLIFLVLLLPIQVFAQFQKGDKFINGTLSLSSQDNPQGSSGFKSTGFSVAPHLGFFINKSVAIGGAFRYSYQKTEDDNEFGSYRNTERNIGIAAFGRKYFSISDNFLFFVEGELAYGWRTSKDLTGTIKSTAAIVSVSPHFTFFPSHRWSIEGGVGIVSFRYDDYKNTDASSGIFQISLGTVNFGVSYFLTRANETN